MGALTCSFLGGTEEEHEIISQNNRCSDHDFNSGPPELTCKVLPLNQSGKWPRCGREISKLGCLVRFVKHMGRLVNNLVFGACRYNDCLLVVLLLGLPTSDAPLNCRPFSYSEDSNRSSFRKCVFCSESKTP
jgi:hypothetical protein